MFNQLLTPVGDSLILSFLLAILPIVVVLVLLGVLRRPAWQASLGGLLVALAIATTLWQFPVGLALDSVAAGAVFALWPVMWIVFNALLLYNITVMSGRFDAFRDWVVDHLPDDRRVVLVVIGFCFGCLLEGISGFGTPVAITSALLILVGYPPLEALTFTLIFNTAPVAFGALGAPVTVLGQVTGLSPVTLGAMIGRQLPFFAVMLPFYVIAIYGGIRLGAGPLAGPAGGRRQFRPGPVRLVQLSRLLVDRRPLVADLAGRDAAVPAGLVAAAGSRVQDDGADRARRGRGDAEHRAGLAGLDPVDPGLCRRDRLDPLQDLRHRPADDCLARSAQPGVHHPLQEALCGQLGLPAVRHRHRHPARRDHDGGDRRRRSGALPPGRGGHVAASRIAILTVALIVGLAYLMNYSGMNYTLGLGVASLGIFFPVVSAFLGWVAVFLSGSDTSGNALFGNLQVVAANQLGLNPVLIAATNSSGGVMGKMISPQNIATGVSVTDLKGQEGVVFARTFKHSIVLTILLGVLVVVQQYLVPWMIPS